MTSKIGTSIIPHRKRMIKEYLYHAYEYNWLLAEGHLSGGLSPSDHREFIWHGQEMEKLEKVLDALYSGWDAGLNT